MSFIDSPPIRRLSVSAAKEQEDLINAYEAEEEKIINVLSRKLEKLREEKIDLENTLEAESESHVNRLSRELTALRLAQHQQSEVGGVANGHPAGFVSPSEPSADMMLEAMRRENEMLRNRLVDTERDYIRITRLNEIYREELIEHRRRLGLPVDNLIGMSSTEPFSMPTHHRRRSLSSSSSIRSTAHAPNGVPIPRPPSQIHRPANASFTLSSEGNTPLTYSPVSSFHSESSPFPLSPSSTGTTSTGTSSSVNLRDLNDLHDPTTSISSSFAGTSYSTTLTSPASPQSINTTLLTFSTPSRGLTYPSVPPPSLSSSFGSPTVSYHIRDHMRDRSTGGTRDPSLSPVDHTTPYSRRGSITGRHTARVAETGTLRRASTSTSSSQAGQQGGGGVDVVVSASSTSATSAASSSTESGSEITTSRRGLLSSMIEQVQEEREQQQHATSSS